MDKQKILEMVRLYLQENLLFFDDELDIANDTSFLEIDIIDSTGIIELVVFVEETFNIKVNDDEITRDNFDSIEKISNYVARKSDNP